MAFGGRYHIAAKADSRIIPAARKAEAGSPANIQYTLKPTARAAIEIRDRIQPSE